MIFSAYQRWDFSFSRQQRAPPRISTHAARRFAFSLIAAISRTYIKPPIPLTLTLFAEALYYHASRQLGLL